MKLFLAFFSVRKFAACVLLSLMLAVDAAAEGRVPFASTLGGFMSPTGLPGYRSTPARTSEPAFGIEGYWLSDVDEWALLAAGEMQLYSSRLSFFYMFHALDSIYRDSYSELQFSWHRNWLVLGGAYGVEIDWMPGKSVWARHRYKFAVDLCWRSFHFEGMLDGFTDSRLDGNVGIFWEGGENARLFAESGFEKLALGFDFLWKNFSLKTSYRFPDFAVAVSVNVALGAYGIFYAHGFAANSLGWNGLGVCRRVKK